MVAGCCGAVLAGGVQAQMSSVSGPSAIAAVACRAISCRRSALSFALICSFSVVLCRARSLASLQRTSMRSLTAALVCCPACPAARPPACSPHLQPLQPLLQTRHFLAVPRSQHFTDAWRSKTAHRGILAAAAAVPVRFCKVNRTRHGSGGQFSGWRRGCQWSHWHSKWRAARCAPPAVLQKVKAW